MLKSHKLNYDTLGFTGWIKAHMNHAVSSQSQLFVFQIFKWAENQCSCKPWDCGTQRKYCEQVFVAFKSKQQGIIFHIYLINIHN